MVNWIKVSKQMAYYLRHHPSGMDISEEGFVPLNELLSRLRERWPDLVEEDVRGIVGKDRKWRYEIREEQIRARYGHSDAVKALLKAKGKLEKLRKVEKEHEKLKRKYERLKGEMEDLQSKSKREDLKNLKEALWAVDGYLERIKRDNKEGRISDREYQEKKKALLKEKWDVQHKMLILKDWLEEAMKRQKWLKRMGKNLSKERN